MKVFVSDRSAAVRERLIGMISSIEGVEVVGRDEDGKNVAETVQRLNPGVVVLDMDSGALERLERLQLVKAGHEAPVLVVLTDSLAFPFSEKLLSAGADFVFHRALEFGKLLVLITRISEETL